MATELCNGCGACCNPVSLPHSRREVEQMPPWKIDAYSRWWILNILTPISRREGLALAPWQRSNSAMPLVAGVIEPRWSSFYRCAWFDAETRTCTEHERRPDVCRTYPRQGEARVHPLAALPPMCGYRVEQGKPVEPMPEDWHPVLFRPPGKKSAGP